MCWQHFKHCDDVLSTLPRRSELAKEIPALQAAISQLEGGAAGDQALSGHWETRSIAVDRLTRHLMCKSAMQFFLEFCKRDEFKREFFIQNIQTIVIYDKILSSLHLLRLELISHHFSTDVLITRALGIKVSRNLNLYYYFVSF